MLGVGSAVNRSLACALARAGRGVEVIVGGRDAEGHDDEDAERGAKRLLDRTARPVLTNLAISGTALVRHAPEHVPDVFAAAPVVAALQLKSEGGTLVVRGELAGEPWEQRLTVRAQPAGEGDQAIVALYAREHVADLESRAALEPGMHDREIETTGVTFQIATRLTSWVAIDESRVTTGPVRDAAIPQELPYGTIAQAFGLRPATSAMVMPQGLAIESADFVTGSMPARARPSAAPAGLLAKRDQAGFPMQAMPSSHTRSSRPRYLVVVLAILGLLALLYWLRR